MKNIKLLALLTLTLTLSSCSYYDFFLKPSEGDSSSSETSENSSSSSSEEIIPPGSNYYRSTFANDTYHDLGKKSVYQTYYPNSVGDLNLLVVPVVISGYRNIANDNTRNKIEKGFFGSEEDTGWESVSTYFNKSSFGRLNIKGHVTEWFDSGLSPLQLYNLENKEYGDGGTFVINKMIYEWLKDDLGYDLTKYDLNKDGYIDAIWMVYSAPIHAPIKGVSDANNPFWAFVYWNYLFAGKGNVSSPVPNSYAWASHEFFDDGAKYGINIDSHTFIHETGHLLGLDDYYDYDNLHSPLGRLDMQDYNVGDHNAYTKLALGWSRPYVVTGDSTITINPASMTGHSILIRDPKKPWEGSAFDEYLLLELITPTGLWKQDMTKGYAGIGSKYTEPGVRMLKVDARLLSQTNKITRNTRGNSLYMHAFSNTPSSSLYEGSISYRYDLLSLIASDKTRNHLVANGSADNECLFKTGDRFTMSDYSQFFKNNKLNDSSTIPYEIDFDLVDSEKAVIRFNYLGD